MTDQPASQQARDIPVLTPPRPYTQQRGGGPAWLALLIAVGAGAAAGWLWLANQQLDAQVAELQARPLEWPGAAALQAGLADSRQALAVSATRIGSLETAQKELHSALDATARELRSTRQDLSEAEYLQRLAAQSLLMGRDPRGALTLLEASDAILRQRDDPAFHEARARLAEDIAALRALAGFDVEGLYLRLSALSAAIPSIAFTEPHLPASADAPAAEAADAPADWVDRAEALLAQYIAIRHDAPAAKALPTPGEETLLRANLRLLVEQAKLGLLAGEQKVYAGALADAGELLRSRFGVEPAANRSFLEESERLAGQTIDPEMPDLADSLAALRSAAQSGGGG
jgi:uroporphyrin-3 C-methyltransferase